MKDGHGDCCLIGNDTQLQAITESDIAMAVDSARVKARKLVEGLVMGEILCSNGALDST